ncbi:hypothetical protein GLYMA_19G141900v4 [Glycine max]|nr:uncharacterized protein LOC100800773 isoform X1 [Glycine max]XP_028218534.1 uncharacterized protein LOC114400323 isoform X1 [Glycine soja]KHN26335.1 hypothetical protein glysoja_029289 [Glycine soja]KRG95294.1 hypothetical protein GLYMA_19G141900v4 [Glycine max]RZB47900.1 hypothetical protein D0Y65_051455 [Glycine soja]|eukprot:XP_006604369.1 uncharacterized protein LOC100800773 isoform X1 [Glycine max]
MEGEEELLWKSEPQRESIVSVSLARAITSLLTSRPKKLHDSIHRLSSHSRSHTSLASLEDSLWFFLSFVTDSRTNNSSLDEVLLPVIDNALKSKHGDQAMILLSWLFQDELLFQPVAEALASIVSRKHVHDRYLLLGWCLLLRNLVEFENSAHQSMFGGIRGRYGDLLKILSTCLPDLAGIVSKGSTLQDGFELPSRLGVSAADCFLSLSGALTKVAESKKSKLNTRAKDQEITFVQSPTIDKKVNLESKSLLMSKIERDYTLWHHLDDIICLVQRLLSWSKKSRFLHAKGLGQVLKWLEEIKDHYGSFQHEAALKTDSNVLKTGDLLLSSCWKHYSMLLHLEDKKFSQHYKELLNQYMSGIQHYMDNHTGGGYTDNNDGGLETRKFFLNCLCLLLGRLDSKRFESMVSEFGMNISCILVPQLNCTDEDVIVGVVSIFKAIILRPDYSQEDALTDNRQANSVIPFLLHLLDEQDGTAKAVVMLIAEYCSMSEGDQCLMEVLKRLASGNISQRRNAMDVISEVLHISSKSQNLMPSSAWQDMANKLLERLGDEETKIREQASKLLPMIDPPLYLPALVGLVYSPDESQSSASDAIIGVLKHHNQRIEIIFLLLDCLSNMSKSLDLTQSTGDKGSKLDADQVLKLVPVWSKSVQDWNLLIGPLVDKMFGDPSNATIVKFLSYISENLANVADLVLHHVLLHVKEQKKIDESFLSRWEQRTYTCDEFEEMQQSLFEHLCPLLIIKILPLKTFNDLNSSIMYGHLSQNIIQDAGSRDTDIDYDCIAAFLLNRAFCEFEFEEVRKLSAELCGRIHPQVLLPFVCSLLERAVDSKNVLKIKACLFSICTSLMVRGWESLSHPSMYSIRKMIETVLLWPCLNADSVSKAQHGCIDCLALMICAELQAKESINNSIPDTVRALGKKGNSVVTYVINQFFNNKNEQTSTPEFGDENSEFVAAVSLSFCLCMGNVLISTCQKISESCKKPFAAQVIPFLLHSLEFETKSEIRAACTQVLFSAVYHLRSAVLPYASDLLRMALKALRKESDKERMAGAKLIASLMASEDMILENISVGLLQARSVLSTISSSDPSPELQQLCCKLLACISSP